jgi:ABC-type transporter Mla subunit MlaD
MEVMTPIGALVANVTAILERAAQAPRDWQARLKTFAQAVSGILETIAAVRDQLAGGLDALASVVANWNSVLGTLAGTAQGASMTVNATQNISLAASIAADVNVRVWVGETELRSIIREEVDTAVREALVRAV